MAIWLTAQSRILVQNMTGREGSKHTRRILPPGPTVVAGVNPGKGGQEFEVLPLFNTVAEAMSATDADVSVVFVPPKGGKSAVIDAIDAAIPLCVIITEGAPLHDTTEVWAYASTKGNATRFIGP